MQQDIVKKWGLIDFQINKHKLNLQLGKENTSQQIHRLQRIKKLKEKVDKDDFELKREYLMLLHERNLYLKKIKQLRNFGESRGWEDKQGLLRGLKKVLDYHQFGVGVVEEKKR